jgi:plasmid stabilization system protein ParE
MAYKIIFAPTAIARLQDIVRYIAADDPATAKTFAMHLLNRAALLSEFPELGTPYRKRKNVRRCGAILISSTIASAAKTI